MDTSPDSKQNGNLNNALMARRTVVLQGKITHDLMNQVMGKLLTLQVSSSEPINLIIDSGGGATFAALKLCDFITYFMHAPVKGIVHGQCSSAATFVLLACKERVCTPHSYFVIHSGRMNDVEVSISDNTAEELEQLLADLRNTKDIVFKYYMDKLGKTADEVKGLIMRGDQKFNEEMRPSEALKIGLVTQIVTEPLDILKQ